MKDLLLVIYHSITKNAIADHKGDIPQQVMFIMCLGFLFKTGMVAAFNFEANLMINYRTTN